MQCPRCKATMQADALSCPVCALPMSSTPLTSESNPGEPTVPVLSNTDVTTSSGLPAPLDYPPPAGYENFSFQELYPTSPYQAGPNALPIASGGLPNSPPVKKKRSHLGLIILILALVVVVVGASGGIFLYASSQINRKSVQNKATDPVNPMQLYKQVTSSIALIYDPMNAATDHMWEHLQTSDTKCVFQDHAYHIIEKHAHYFAICHAIYDPVNFALQVKMNFLQGNYGGLVFRANSHTGALYRFNFDGAGHYYFDRYRDFFGKDTVMLTSGFALPFQVGYHQVNVITIIAQGPRFYFYVNAQFVTQFTDAFLTSGLIGLDAANQTGLTDIAFTNAKLWDLDVT